MRTRSAIWAAVVGLWLGGTAVAGAEEGTIPVGVAKVDITPETPVRMYGYAQRTEESEGVAGPLKASALAIGGDEGEGPAVLLSVDLGAVPREMRDRLLERIQQHARLQSPRFMLSHTHVHSGPNLKQTRLLTGKEREHMEQYSTMLLDRLERAVLDALAARRPGQLALAEGAVKFAMNRRVLENGKWAKFGAATEGPVDHSLPVLRVIDAEGKLLAVVANYACHCTTMRGNFRQIHGDWAGWAQQFIEAEHPGAVAMMTIGCGADADPWPHTDDPVALSRRHGRELADEVKRLIAGEMKPVAPRLAVRSAVIEFPYLPMPSAEELKTDAERRAVVEDVVKRLLSGQATPVHESFEVAVWAFGDDLAMVFLNHEVVVDFVLRLKQEFDGRRLWVTAYTNDVSHYIASDRLFAEGGYEVRNSLSARLTYGRPELVKPSVETQIIAAVGKLLPESFRR